MDTSVYLHVVLPDSLKNVFHASRHAVLHIVDRLFAAANTDGNRSPVGEAGQLGASIDLNFSWGYLCHCCSLFPGSTEAYHIFVAVGFRCNWKQSSKQARGAASHCCVEQKAAKCYYGNIRVVHCGTRSRGFPSRPVSSKMNLGGELK